MAFEHEEIPRDDYRKAMRRLVSKEGLPADIHWEMERRVDAVDKFRSGTMSREELLAICHDYRDTGDGIVRMANGDVKIVRHSPALLGIAKDAELVNYGLGHTDDPYPDVSPIPAEIVGHDFNRRLAKGEAEKNEGLLQLAGGDQQLVVAHDGAIRYVRGEVLGLNAEQVSGIYVYDSVKGFNVERAAVLDRCDDYGSGRGGVDARGLGNDARLARVAPEALGLEPRSGALGLSIDDAIQQVYAPLQPFLGKANQEQVQAALRGALAPVLAVRDTAYREKVVDSVRTLAADYIGPKPLAELETQLDTLQCD